MADLSKQTTDSIKKSILEKREELRGFRFGGAGSRTRDVRKGRNLRTEIARLLTELKNREISGTQSGAKQ